MALIACPECGSEVSDKAPTCPRCGAPIAPAKLANVPTSRRRVRTVVILSVAGVVLLLLAGYAAWGSVSANAHNEAWKAETSKIAGFSSNTSVVILAPDGTAVSFASKVLPTCTTVESEAKYQAYVKITADALGYTPSEALLAVNGITRIWATAQCNDDKKRDFASAVSETQAHLALFLKSVKAPDSVNSRIEGMRGLDGTQTQTFFAPKVGDLTVESRYDGMNGLSVTLSRAHETLDWAAPFRG